MESEEIEKIPRRRRAGAFHLDSNFEIPVDVSREGLIPRKQCGPRKITLNPTNRRSDPSLRKNSSRSRSRHLNSSAKKKAFASETMIKTFYNFLNNFGGYETSSRIFERCCFLTSYGMFNIT